MPTKDQKKESLKAAIVIAKEFARGGSSQAVSNVLQAVYDTLNNIKDDIAEGDAAAEQKPAEE